ncbi:MAG: amine dehydrogenase large subunit [Candidatus Limnocylindria bacterium]
MFHRWLLCALLLAGTARADLPVETTGSVEVLPVPFGPHWAWASDVVLRRIALVDLESGRTLGMLDGGFGVASALFPTQRREIYLPETHYSRGSRGERTDVVTIYDAVTLAPVAEVKIPPGRAINALSAANAALSDDERFVAVFDYTPATALSIVDVERRAFVGEIATPGCSLAYAAGPRRFAMLCADGALLTVTLDANGRESGRERSKPFFDPARDPVTEKAVRWGDRWLFVSFEGLVHPVDASGSPPRFGERWSLLDSTDRAEGWRIGGHQHLALHGPTGRLYSLMHQGGPDTHKQPGTELWVYDVEGRRRLQRIQLRSPGFTYLGVPVGNDWPWPLSRIQDWLVAYLPDLGVGSVAVTQDDQPLLVTGSNFSGSLAVYDALSGEFLRRVAPGNMTTLGLQTPWTGAETAR